jgi:DNA-binding transcriptional MerR regulator
MLTPTKPLLRIGELQAESGVPIKTIRYYEELGLIRAERRTEGGFRLFSTDMLPRLAFIKRSQRLGFSLHEIGHILAIHDRGELPCGEVRQHLQSKVAEIDRQIEQLRTLQTELRSLLGGQQPPPIAATEPRLVRSPGTICPIIQPD